MSAQGLRVVAGVLRDAAGRVLLAQRPSGKHLAGLWEFPGGKVESDEATVDALARELREELGIVVESARPLIAAAHDYPDRCIVLDAWEVTAWSGTPVAHEHAALAWAEVDELSRVPMPPADLPVVAALRLPERYLITPALPPGRADDVLRGIERALAGGIRLVQLRLPGWTREQLAPVARRVRDICHAQGARVLLAGDSMLAAVLGLDGVHLPARVAATLSARPLPSGASVGVSCHDAAELAHAHAIGADFATLSPVHATASHPDREPLGWDRFADLVATARLPVYALGGMEGEDVDEARMSGAQGIAAIRALWADSPTVPASDSRQSPIA
jgi:8-oxo-dGTP diphosphatase